MSRRSSGNLIRLRGVRHNNLKNFDLDLPTGQLIVVTGLSGSGKSSLAFDTLYAEGQRRYIETFSPYARQFLDRMDKPQVDSIQGIPPAIAIEQRNAVKSTRSTVGTMTEICEYMKPVWGHVAQLYCRKCGRLVRKDSPQSIWDELGRDNAQAAGPATEVVITFQVPLSAKLPLEESLSLVTRQGYQRLLIQSEHGDRQFELLRIEEAASRWTAGEPPAGLTVVQDRLRLGPANRARFIEGCEQAYHFGKGKLEIRFLDHRAAMRFSNQLHCAACDEQYRSPSPALFSFNHPVGACPKCRGFGRTITIDYALAIPDRSLTLAQGAVKPWQSGQSAECQRDLTQFCRKRRIPMDVPFEKLSPEFQSWVIDGEPDYGQDEQHQWPHSWYGVKGYFRWLESRAYKMHVRVLLSRYRTYQTCPDCAGRRFQPESLLFKVQGPEGEMLTLADFYGLTIERALDFLQRLVPSASGRGRKADPLQLALDEVRSRLTYLKDVGLEYLTLDRPTRSLSGGETERVNLTTCIGSRLVNTLFVLDEPTVGLHPRDTQRLIRILQRLRDAGNTLVVVEHEASVMREADRLVDLGPGHGEAGGHLVFQGTFGEILRSRQSITGQFLRGDQRIELPDRRPVRKAISAGSAAGPGLNPSAPFENHNYLCPTLRVIQASCHNLRALSVDIPLGRFVCVTGVSGSGKTTLVKDVLLPWLSSQLNATAAPPNPDGNEDEDEVEPIEHCTRRVEGAEHLGRVVLVDQSSLGKTPRSNPAVYIGAFEHIRQVFAESDTAKKAGLNASAFSFNSSQGQCELCRGAGFEKIEMQFLSDVYVRCPACQGRRYRQHILEVTIARPDSPAARSSAKGKGRAVSHPPSQALSIADVLESTVDDAIDFLRAFSNSRAAGRAVKQLEWLQRVGLGYLRLGQPINTLSGGESQRLKLVSHLAAFSTAQERQPKPTLFLFDEPTTGLHFADVRVLVAVFQQLVDQGHSVVAVEHNLDLIKCADWVIDLGPESGEGGGRVVMAGTPEQVAGCAASHTGQSLRESGVK